MGAKKSTWKHVYYKRVSKLYVVLGDEGWYEFFDVPASVNDSLRAAPDQEAYFKKHILKKFKHRTHTRSDTPPARFTIRFAEKFPIEQIEGMLETNFIGLGNVYRRDEPRVVFLTPFPDADPALKELLEEMKAEGLLTYAREPR